MGEIVQWNVVRPPRLLRRAPKRLHRFISRPEDNVGDLLGPVVVRLLLAQRGLPEGMLPAGRLLTVGSIMHLARPGDVVWGSGRNARVSDANHHLDDLDVRAVRGPLTREWLHGNGVACPEVFGDPALLLPGLRPDLVKLSASKRHRVTFVRHFDDVPSLPRRGVTVRSARGDAEALLRTIVQSELVVSTSLHGVVVAEAFGVPARAIRNRFEPEFKFSDYFAATGRPGAQRLASLDDAIAAGGEQAIVFDPSPLLAAFPWDMFSPAAGGAECRS
ncbi:MAG: hypothetical protein RI958_394 [Actinomycetota bacterium]